MDFKKLQNVSIHLWIEKDEVKQGECVMKVTKEADLKNKEGFKNCGSLTAIDCVCNTPDCNKVTAKDKIPENFGNHQASHYSNLSTFMIVICVIPTLALSLRRTINLTL